MRRRANRLGRAIDTAVAQRDTPIGPGVYIHVPWCRVRCPYCAFAVDARKERPGAAWRDGVLRDWALQAVHFDQRPSTLYFGGGTPSLAEPTHVAAVIQAVAPSGEISLEANPGDLEPGRLAALSDIGVTRLSIGVQSFVPATARRLGRGHRVGENRSLVERALRAGFRSVSIDLVFGVPGQTMDALREDLAVAGALGVHHLSCYGLTIEPGTPFHRAGWTAAEGDAWAESYAEAVDRLETAGLHRYEVSNFARPGHRCVHNEHYWRARPWAGLGPSAHAWLPGGERWAQVPGFDDWAAGAPPTVERPGPRALLQELTWSTLRHRDGIDLDKVEAICGMRPRVPRDAPWAPLLAVTPGAIRLMPGAYALADALAEQIAKTTLTGYPGEPGTGLA
jgi:oxygen-independent coproporphyrinogen-3 oxidase